MANHEAEDEILENDAEELGEATENVSTTSSEATQAPVNTQAVKEIVVDNESATVLVEFTESMTFDWRGHVIRKVRGERMKVSADLKTVLVARGCVKVL